jgi:hypothetical protein
MKVIFDEFTDTLLFGFVIGFVVGVVVMLVFFK